MSAQHFCFKWNNYQSNMSEVFQNMRINESMVDVTLACDGSSLKAHKMVLSACSPFFQSLFLSNPCKHPIVIMKDIEFADLKATIDFMYRGEVSVSQDQLASLLKTAETLRVKGLSDITEKQARGHPNQLLLHNTSVHQQLVHGQMTIPRKKRRRSRKSLSPQPLNLGAIEGTFLDSENDSEYDGNSGRIFDGMIQTTTVDDEEDEESKHEKIDNDEEMETIQTTEQLEPSRILEQSIAAADVENGQEQVVLAHEIQTGEETIKQVALMQESMGYDTSLGTYKGTKSTGNQGWEIIEMGNEGNSSLLGISHGLSPHSKPQAARRLIMSEAQKMQLRDYLTRPIACFNVETDITKKSIVWHYFGELTYRDPETGVTTIVDKDRHYCLKCISDNQVRNLDETFEKCNICFLSNGTATGNHKNHLRLKHHIVDEQLRIAPPRVAHSVSGQAMMAAQSAAAAAAKARKRPSKVMIISLDEIVAVDN